MPQIVCLFLLAGLIAVFVFTSPPWRWLRTFLIWWYLGIALDLLFNTGLGLFGAAGDGTDWKRFAEDHGTWAFLLSWVILIAVVSQVFWIKYAAWDENEPAGKGFFEYRGLAIAYAAVSLVAMIVSFTVQHESIERNWWFWLVWSGQAISFVGYLIYLWGLTYRGWSKGVAASSRV
jgi:hypothetical protein